MWESMIKYDKVCFKLEMYEKVRKMLNSYKELLKEKKLEEIGGRGHRDSLLKGQKYKGRTSKHFTRHLATEHDSAV